MRVRAFDKNGDYRFGGLNQYLVDTPEAVAQAIGTRLRLMVGEWFLDLDAGTNYSGDVFGYHTQDVRDIEIQQRVLGTPGVNQILEYESSVNDRRKFKVAMRLDTIYGEASLTETL